MKLWKLTAEVTCRSCPFQLEGTVEGYDTPERPWYYRERSTRWSLSTGQPGEDVEGAVTGHIIASGRCRDHDDLTVAMMRIVSEFRWILTA